MTERRKHERVFSYAYGDALATVAVDSVRMGYRIEIRENGKFLCEHFEYDRVRAFQVARDAVNYINKRGV